MPRHANRDATLGATEFDRCFLGYSREEDFQRTDREFVRLITFGRLGRSDEFNDVRGEDRERFSMGVGRGEFPVGDELVHRFTVELQFLHAESPGELGFGVRVGVATDADGDQVLGLVCAAFVALDNVMDLQVKRSKAATDATVPCTLGQYRSSHFR
jgi:hypothetical protein